jgi:hypothetical protein
MSQRSPWPHNGVWAYLISGPCGHLLLRQAGFNPVLDLALRFWLPRSTTQDSQPGHHPELLERVRAEPMMSWLPYHNIQCSVRPLQRYSISIENVNSQNWKMLFVFWFEWGTGYSIKMSRWFGDDLIMWRAWSHFCLPFVHIFQVQGNSIIFQVLKCWKLKSAVNFHKPYNTTVCQYVFPGLLRYV